LTCGLSFGYKEHLPGPKIAQTHPDEENPKRRT
jgi:hypothetical protein